MKMKAWIGLILIGLALNGLAAAETESRPAPKNVRKPEVSVDRQAAARSREVSADRQQAYREMADRRSQVHQAAIKELEDIKKIAEEEGATQTVAALQKLIDQKNEEYKKGVEQFEKVRRERAERIRERQAKAKPADQPKETKEKADGQDTN